MKIPKILSNPAGLYVLGSLYPYATGGMEIFNYYFLNYQLKDSKNTIFYLGEKRAESENGFFLPLKKQWPVKFFYPLQFFFSVYKVRKLIRYAYLSYAEQSWIIVYFQSLTLRFFKIPYIITIHWGKEPDWKFKYPFVHYFRHAQAVIGVSKPICIAFKKTIPDQEFKFIPPLIPFQQSIRTKPELKIQLGYQNNEKILLYVGSLKAMKNPDKIIESFRKMGVEYLEEQNIRLLFVGNGEMENEIRGRVENYRLGKYIRVEGLIKRETIPDYYKAADVYIISSDYEGTSLSLLEAMYNRLAIIASDAPGINSMLMHEQNALLYETTDTTRLAETIIRIFTDHLLADRLAEKAFEDFNSRYSYKSMINEYQAVFSSVSF
jgi:glycosyltransferase involved in cell wall biosynthesis